LAVRSTVGKGSMFSLTLPYGVVAAADMPRETMMA